MQVLQTGGRVRARKQATQEWQKMRPPGSLFFRNMGGLPLKASIKKTKRHEAVAAAGRLHSLSTTASTCLEGRQDPGGAPSTCVCACVMCVSCV